MKDNVHVLFEGMILEHIVKLEPSLYRKQIWYNQKGNLRYMYDLEKPYTVQYKDLGISFRDT